MLHHQETFYPTRLPPLRAGWREQGWGDPPQDSVGDNGEGQEDHGGSTPSLGNACEGLHSGFVQDRPLWATPKQEPVSWRPGPCTPKGVASARQPPSGTGVWALPKLLPVAGRRRSGGYSGTQSLRLPAPWSSPRKTSLLFALQGRGGKREERVPERKGRKQRGGKRGEGPCGWSLCPLREPILSPPILPREGRPGPTFSHIPEYTGEGHVLKPENGSQGRGKGRLGEERGDCGEVGERTTCSHALACVCLW